MQSYQTSHKVPASGADSLSNPSSDIFGSGSNSMSLPSSSCSGASSPRAGRSDSFDGGLSTTTKRQRSRSSHVKPSKEQEEAKAAKNSLMSSIQMSLIKAVNNKEVTKREKKLDQAELSRINGSNAQYSVLQNNFTRGDDSDVAARKDRSGVKKNIGSHDLINLINERPVGDERAAHENKTRANRIPCSSKLVFSNLSQQQNCNASTPSVSEMSVAAESQNQAPKKQSSIEMPKESLQTQNMIRDRKTQPSSLTPRGSNETGQIGTRTGNLSLNLHSNGLEQPKHQTSLTPNHSTGSSILFNQQSESTNDSIQSNGLRSAAPVLSAPERERQIKYLGLVIEKDEEWDIEEDDVDMFRKYKSLRAELMAYENGTMNTDEQPYVQRQYFPVRDRYIKIVKNCRRRAIESFEKRGGKDFKRTLRSLFSIAQTEHVRYQQLMNSRGAAVRSHRR